jgi:hypothetical protein
MKVGEEFEYEKATFKKKLKVRQVSNASDEEGTLAQAFTRFDNDDNTDQFAELVSEGIIQNELLTDGGINRRYQEHALSSKKSKQRRVFYSPSQRMGLISNNQGQPRTQILMDGRSERGTDKTQSGSGGNSPKRQHAHKGILDDIDDDLEN